MIKKAVACLCVLLPSGLTRILYRLVGFKVGRNVRLPFLSFVQADSIELGDDVDIRPFVFIRVRKLVLGRCTIVSFGAQIKGDRDLVTGDNCFIGAHSIIHCDENVLFGFYSGIGPRSMIYTHGSFLPVTLGYPASFAEVRLENFVWTAMGVMFLPGAHVESECLISPGVVVGGRIKGGTRLQFSKDVFSSLDQNRLLKFSRRPPAHYHKLIVEGFLTSVGETFASINEGKVHRTSTGIEFRSFPDTNHLELFRNGRRIAGYDLAGFSTDVASDALHREFLIFIRRRFGLTLRPCYADRAQPAN